MTSAPADGEITYGLAQAYALAGRKTEARKLVNLMGGKISLTSTFGEGSTFSLELNLEAAEL